MRMIDADKLITRLMDAELDQIQSKTGEELCQIVESMATVEQTDDAISRQAALDAFGLSEKTRKYGGDHSGYDTMMLYEIQQTLEDLPTVTPKQRTGHWIIHGEPPINVIECSECGQKYHNHYCQPLAHFCSMCGCRMVEPQESEEQTGKER